MACAGAGSNVIGLIASLSLAAVAYLARTPPETGAGRDWRGELAERNRRQAKRTSRKTRRASGPRYRESAVDCCGAPDDDWRVSRAVYDRWTAPTPTTYREALAECWNESVEAAARGDYSKPASRRCALGKMHQAKLSLWQQCRDGCYGTGAPVYDRRPADDGTGGTLWYREGVADVVRVAPNGGGWSVDQQRNGRGRWSALAWFDDEADADQAARDALEPDPF